MFFNLVRKYVIMSVAVPVAAAVARRLTDAVEARRGPSRGTRLVRKGADSLQNTFGRRTKRPRFPLFGR
jgi:hypothetical protein